MAEKIKWKAGEMDQFTGKFGQTWPVGWVDGRDVFRIKCDTDYYQRKEGHKPLKLKATILAQTDEEKKKKGKYVSVTFSKEFKTIDELKKAAQKLFDDHTEKFIEQ
jgi:hypothetical protein